MWSFASCGPRSRAGFSGRSASPSLLAAVTTRVGCYSMLLLPLLRFRFVELLTTTLTLLIRRAVMMLMCLGLGRLVEALDAAMSLFEYCGRCSMVGCIYRSELPIFKTKQKIVKKKVNYKL